MNAWTDDLRGSLPASDTASDTLPVELTEDVDVELVDLLCDDAGWLDETFREIVATSWAEPPRGGAARQAARPRRYGVPGDRRVRRTAVAESQWFARPTGRGRSPPGPGTA